MCGIAERRECELCGVAVYVLEYVGDKKMCIPCREKSAKPTGAKLPKSLVKDEQMEDAANYEVSS